MKVALIPCSPSDWTHEGRILGRTELPPSDSAELSISTTVESLRAIAPTKLFHAPDELSTHMAKAIGKALKLTAKSKDELLEVDMGLWAGLTDEQLRTRFSSAYHLLEESPLNVSPPGGEDFRTAAERLAQVIAKLRKRAGEGPVAVVLRPIAMALVRAHCGEIAETEVWSAATDASGVVFVEYRPA
ncbi:MAG: histidine phosphatase family protein [Phycisphaerae bacterium]